MDPDGRLLPVAIPLVVKTFTVGMAITNVIRACYCCYLWNDCRDRAQASARAATDQWENLLDKKDGLEYERTMENYRRNMIAASAANSWLVAGNPASKPSFGLQDGILFTRSNGLRVSVCGPPVLR